MKSLEISIGIKTHGKPVIKQGDKFIIVENMLIGDGFHWQKTVRAKLPGKIKEWEETSKRNIKRGEIEDHVTLINTLPLESYLECVVGSEMNPLAPVEFLKAHAVISRSWAVGKILGIHPRGGNIEKECEGVLMGWDDTGIHMDYHVCSDDHCQRYQGLQPISSIALKAIRETHDEVLMTNEGNILDARFSKCCGGRTELFETCWQSQKISGLESIVDPWCDLSGLSATSRRALLSTILKDYDLTTKGYGYSWEVEVPKEAIRRRLSDCFGKDVGEVMKIEALHRGPSGRIDILKVEGSEGCIRIGKELWIRRLLSESHLYSSAFDIQDKGNKVALTGKGWGHGVGLCQIGAAYMASQGYKYKDILSFYYPGTRVEKARFPMVEK